MAVRDLSSFQWDRRIQISEREPPTRIAPYAAALDADIVNEQRDVASGRLILLHNPQGDESWGGDFRCVTFAQASVGPDMIHDPFLSHVGWSWLIDALDTCGASYSAESGTVTTTFSTPFGTKEAEAQSSQIEMRASWTALLDDDHSLTAHLKAWQELLRELAGIPPEHDTVIPLAMRTAGRK